MEVGDAKRNTRRFKMLPIYQGVKCLIKTVQ